MYKLEGSSRAPQITFDTEKGFLEIEGKSIPENPHEIYLPVLEEVERYGEHPANSTQLDIRLSYFNTTTSKYLLDIIKDFITLHEEERTSVTINWYYHEGDEDMLEIGEDFKDLLDFPFHFFALK